MNKINFFKHPTQVRFWDVDGDHYVGGIAYRDEVICGCCGGIYKISEIYDFTPSNITPIVAYENWIDIQAEIVGEDFPPEDTLDLLS